MSSVTINGNTYNVASFNGYGYIDNIFNLAADQVVVAGESASSAEISEEWATKTYNSTVTGGGGEFSAKHYSTQASYWANTAEDSTVPGGGGEFSSKHYSAKSDASAQEALGYRNTTLTYRNESETFKNQAQAAAAAADKGIPFITTTGTGSAYVADFNPSVSLADGVMFSLDIHTDALSTTPTVNVNSAGAKTMVIGYDRRPIDTNIVISGVNILCTYDAENDEIAIIGGLPLHELNRTLDARGNTIDDAVIDNSTIQNTHLQNVTGVGARNFTASGAITSGDVVALNSDGTVSAVTGSSVAFAMDAARQNASGLSIDAYDVGIYHQYTDRLIVMDSNNSHVCIISGQEITEPAGADGVDSNFRNTSGRNALVEIEGTDKVLAVYYHTSALRVQVGTINTTTDRITWETEVASATHVCERLYAIYDPIHDDVVVITQGASTTYNDDLYAVAVSISGTTATFGTIAQLDTNYASDDEIFGAVYDRLQKKYVAFFGDSSSYSNGSTSYLRDRLQYTIFSRPTSTTWSVATQKQCVPVNGLTFNLDLNSLGRTKASIDNDGHILLVGFSISTGMDGWLAACLKISKNSLVLKSTSRWLEGNIENSDYFSLAFDRDSNTFATAFFDNASDVCYYAHLSLVNDGEISVDYAAQAGSSGEANTGNVFPAGNGKFALFFDDDGTDYVYINQAAYNDTNADDWIGVAQATVADTESVNVALRGSLDSSQTGLSVNNRYYIADDGSLITTKNDRYLGRALSATELLLAGEA